MIVFCSRYFTDCVLRYDSVCRQKSYIEDSYFLTRMLNKHLLRRMNECRMDWVLATTAAFLKKSFHQTGDAFKSHLKCVYQTRGEELPCTISNYIFMILRQVHLYDAVDTIMHYLRNNDLEDTAQVIQLFYSYDTMCPINISPENDDDTLDATLSWDDIIGLQAFSWPF